MKEVLENYFNLINNYWKQKGLTTVLNNDIIDILDFYIKSEKLHIDMNKSGWTKDYNFIIALSDIKNNQVGYVSISNNECNVTYKNISKNISSFNKFTLNENIDGYFSDSFNINNNKIEHITEFNNDGIFLSNGVIPYLSHNIVSKFSEAYSLHKTESKNLSEKQFVKTLQ